MPRRRRGGAWGLATVLVVALSPLAAVGMAAVAAMMMGAMR